MNNRIHKLDANISNKIAAGEVVERPAAVVKELVENAIDAGATKLTIEIKKAGKELIRVTDNGNGIAAEDVDLAFERHATSKIATVEDIYCVSTLGFRGEALASIGAVSNLEIITRQYDQQTGIKLSLSGGRKLSKDEMGCPLGTTMSVRDLFFNTPARLKFLKSDNAEITAISDIVNKLALSHCEIGFRYIVNGKTMFSTPGKGDLFQSIYAIFEKDLSRNLIEIDKESNGVKIKGYLTNLQYTRGNRSLQTFFVNGRYVKSDILMDGLSMAYKTMLSPGRFPACVIMIEIDFSKVDVNIHPAKTEIKFHQEGIVKQLVYTAVRETLLSFNQTPVVEISDDKMFRRVVMEEKVEEKKEAKVEEKPQLSEMIREHPVYENSNTAKDQSIQRSAENQTEYKISVPKPTYVQQTVSDTGSPKQSFHKQSGHRPADAKTFDYKSLEIQKPFDDVASLEQIAVTKTAVEETAEIYMDLQYIGPLFQTYLVFEKEGLMYLIDQHAAHEKILFESLLEQYRKSELDRQILLDPILIELAYQAHQCALKNNDKFEKLGLAIDDFGGNAIVIREIPVLLDRKSAQALFNKALEDFGTDQLETVRATDERLEKIMQESCKTAIKAHDHMADVEVEKLLDLLKELKDPYTCPHGRPIIISITKSEIEKKFKRT